MFNFYILKDNIEEIAVDEHGRGVHSARESSPSPAGSNYTTASESERQNLNEAANPNYDDKISTSSQQISQESITQSLINNERKLQVDQLQNTIAPIQEQLSSTSSASTIVLGNDPATTPPSTNLAGPSNLKNTTNEAAVSANGAEEIVTGKQDNTSINSRDPGSSTKVRNQN